MASPLLSVRNLCKQYPGVTALQDVDLDLSPRSIHALLGENGAGKSTLIGILSGVTRPDRGEISFRGGPVYWRDARSAKAAGVATVYQEGDLFPDITLAENVALEHGWPRRHGLIDWKQLRLATKSALSEFGLELHPDQEAAQLSAGQRQLIGIAAALAQQAPLLILDEPTSSLSQAESTTLFEHLRRFRDLGGAVLYVSHRLEEVFALADTVTVLRDGRRVWTGPLRETDMGRLIGHMVGRALAASIARPPDDSARVLFSCQGLSAADGSCHAISLEVRSGEVLGLYGLIGAGRSEWAQCVFGLRPVAAGSFQVDGRLARLGTPGAASRHGLAYLPEDRLGQGVCANLSVRANLVLAALRRLATGPFITVSQELRPAAELVRQLDVRLRSLGQPIATLSGGNQQKVVLGRWLACNPAVLILDEPTRGVDVGAKSEIHAILQTLGQQGNAVILISSDLPEVLQYSHRVAVFREGFLVAAYTAGEVTPDQVATAALPVPEQELVAAAAPASAKPWHLAFGGSREVGLLAAVLVLAIGLGLRTETFLQAATLRDVGANAALLAICGLGAALVILAGGIDISFGSIMALSAAVTGWLMQRGWPPPIAIILGLLTGTVAGGQNAALALAGRVHPIVITLGTLSAYRGLTLLLIGQRAIHDVPPSFRAPLQVSILGLPTVIWLALLLVGLAWFLLGSTVGGRQVYALGSNPAAARRAGIDRVHVWLIVFALQGFLAGLAGILALGMAGHLQATDFGEMTLEAVGVAVIGGIAITGGRGSVWGVWGAALLLRILEKGWALLHVSGYWQRTIVGSLLLLAILGDRMYRRARGPKDV